MVALLNDRRAGEPKAGQPAVSAAIKDITTKLVAEADAADPHLAVGAVKLLDQLDPSAALPAASWLARRAPEPTDRITAIRILGGHGKNDADPTRISDLLRSIAEGDEADGERKVRREATRALHLLEMGDVAAAHERLGELAGQNPETWMDHNPQILYGTWGEALRLGLDRVAKAETDESWAEAIDQLDEIAKVLVYRALETGGPSEQALGGLVRQAQGRDLNKWGSIAGSQTLQEKWPWVAFFAANHTKRTAHIVKQGTTTPPPERNDDDFRTALTNFRDGVQPCLDLIAAHTPST